MSVPILEAIADAIYAFEGNKPNNRAYRNRNPGNLRASKWPHTMDARGYCVFATFIEGYSALLEDLRGKATGKNSHGLNLDSTLLQIMNVYAPGGDNNDPIAYAAYLASRIQSTYDAVGITPSTTLRAIYAMEGQVPPDGVATA